MAYKHVRAIGRGSNAAPVVEAPVVDSQLVKELEHCAHAAIGHLHVIQAGVLPWPNLHPSAKGDGGD